MDSNDTNQLYLHPLEGLVSNLLHSYYTIRNLFFQRRNWSTLCDV